MTSVSYTHLVQQGDQVVFQHGLYFGILLVLTVAGLQHEPGIFFRDISRKCEPVVKTVVGQLHGILLVSLGPVSYTHLEQKNAPQREGFSPRGVFCA